MSLPTPLSITLLDRNQIFRNNAAVTKGQVVAGDLMPWFERLEWTNEGIMQTNSGELKLSLDTHGTFIRDPTSPNLFDSYAKANYLIEIQMTQTINGVTYSSVPFRAQLGEANIQEDDEIGEIISVPLLSISYVTKETPCSRQDIFTTPQLRFSNLVIEAGKNGPISPPSVAFFIQTNNLPNNPNLQINWIPSEEVAVHDLMSDVINQVALPSALGGVFTDYYFDDKPSSIFTLSQEIVADVFGGVDSGVVITPIPSGAGSPAGQQQEKTAITDNTRTKNQCILHCAANGGSLPATHMRFASNWLHAAGDGNYRGRPEWDSSQAYTQESQFLVKRTNISASDQNQRLRFFKCIKDVGPTSTFPENDPSHWFEDFSTNPTALTFIDPSPWTSSAVDYAANMAGRGNINLVPYVGMFWDWNIARAIYDTNTRTDPSNPYLTLSVKYVFMHTNDPPTGAQLYPFQRVLVGPVPTGVFIGKIGRVATYLPSGVWTFSNPPTDGDVVNDMDQSNVLKYRTAKPAWSALGIYTPRDYVTDGGLFYHCISPVGPSLTHPSADHIHWTQVSTPWEIVWGVDSSGNGINLGLGGSPFHICSVIQNVTSPTGIPNRAIQATFNWLDQSHGGNDANMSSRGAWLSFMFPYPRLTTSGGEVGHLYGGNGASGVAPILGVFDSYNLTYNRKGQTGWNNGLDSEDLGKISAIRFKMSVALYTKGVETITNLVTGIESIPMIFWTIDVFDRVYYSDFALRRNGGWDDIRIPFGPNAPKQMYIGRPDELFSLLNFTFPWDGYITEKEFSGIQFDWRNVKGFGMMMAAPYLNKSGFYIAGQQAGYDQLTQLLQQGVSYYWNAGQDALAQFSSNYQPIHSNQLVDHANISIDELYFEKELIVNSSLNPLPFARYQKENYESESDYLNAQARAVGIATRLSFYPQFTYFTAAGDVRARFGQTFTLSGPRVPNSPQTLVFKSVKHIWDHSGYHIEGLGVKKFATALLTIDTPSGPSGTVLSLKGFNFTPLSTVTLTYDGIVQATTTADFFGKVFFVNIVPSSTIGQHTYTATDSQTISGSVIFIVSA